MTEKKTNYIIFSKWADYVRKEKTANSDAQ